MLKSKRRTERKVNNISERVKSFCSLGPSLDFYTWAFNRVDGSPSRPLLPYVDEVFNASDLSECSLKGDTWGLLGVTPPV